MSFILDALKKSELERQRQSVPGLVDSGTTRPRPRLPPWAIVLGALLAVNLIVLAVVLTHSWMAAPAPRAATPTHPRAAAADEAGAPGATGSATASGGFSPLDAAPVYAPEIPVTSAPPAPSVAARPAAPDSAGPRAVRHHDPLLSEGGGKPEDYKAEDYKAEDDEVLPTVNEINLTGAQALPELHLDVHVFATRPAERFVYINMRKYHEGSTLQEGPTVERIRRDGVILNYQSLRFLLPRQ